MSISNETKTTSGGPAAIAAWLQAALEKAFGEAAEGCALRVAPATNPAFGDYQCNDAMALAKKLRLPPRAIAQKIVENLSPENAPATATIAGPGFINLAVSPEWLASQLVGVAEIPDVGQGRTVVVDYSSPNVAKSMHIGHIRSTVIGAAIDNIFRALGYRVVADNHIGDWGTQFGIIIHGYRAFADQEALARDPVPELERIYKESYAKAKEDPAWMDACRLETVKLQQGDPENRALWQEFIRLSQSTFDTIYNRLGIRFDTTRGESYYQPQLAGIVDRLVAAGMAHESRGAVVVDLRDLEPAFAEQSRKAVEAALAKGDTESAEREDGKWICIVRKEDGGFNYNTTDFATMETRVKEYAPAKIVIVTDDRQIPHFQQLEVVSRKLGILPAETEFVHVAFGTITDADGHPFSTRKGGMPKLKELLDEAASRALAIVKEKTPELPEAEAAELAEAIGIGAVKYSDLAMDPATTIRFSWDSILTLQGNSGPYLQYAHARICSVLDKARESFPESDPSAAPIALADELERRLAKRLLGFSDAVVQAGAKCRPSVIADYLFALAQDYSSFYQKLPFLKAEPAVRDSRLHLCLHVEAVLKRGLALLGMAAPERI